MTDGALIQMTMTRIATTVLACGLCAAACASGSGADEVSAPSQAAPDTRIVVKTADDLPRWSYEVGPSSMEIATSDERFAALAERVIADRVSALERYRFEDPAQLARWYRSLARMCALIPDYDRAGAFREQAEQVSGKPETGASLGDAVLLAETALARRGLTRASEGYEALLRAGVRDELMRMPIEEIREELITWRGAADVPSIDGVAAAAKSVTDPKIAAGNGVVSAAVVGEIAQWREAYRSLYWLAFIGPVCGEVLDVHAARERDQDRWTPRLVTLSADEAGTEVRIGVWDTGVDPSLFEGLMWTNAGETVNGVDDDGNGYVDDVHGIAQTSAGTPRATILHDLGDLAARRDELMPWLIARAQLEQGVENEQVRAYKQLLRSMDMDQRATHTEELDRVGTYAHGTHVAWIAAAGNPFVRIVNVTHSVPDEAEDARTPSVEEAKAEAASSVAAVEYMRAAGVRVVNMSWLASREHLERDLEERGVGASETERAELARLMFAEQRAGLERAIREAPEMLFVCGAGNFSDDVDFAQYIPAGLRLPNLITVGSVNAVDRVAGFSSRGAAVGIFANGDKAIGALPGGAFAMFSGTSAAAPQVTNAAAKVLALRPELSPVQVIDLLRRTADPLPGSADGLIVNPRRAVDEARRSALK